jgi:hypothetical protein
VLDREGRRLDAEGSEQLLRPLERLPLRERLAHTAEDDLRALPLELHRNDAGARLDPQLDLLQRPA